MINKNLINNKKLRPTRIRDFKMKKFFCNFLAIIVIALICASCVMKVESIKGNGDHISLEKSALSFDKIKSSGNVKVRYFESHEHRVVVTVDSNLEDRVDIYSKNNVLHIGVKSKFVYDSFNFTKYKVDIYSPVLKGVSLSGSGSFEAVDIISGSSFDAAVSGSGKINAVVDCNIFTAKVSGSGRITIAGVSDDANISITGSGRFDGSDFHTLNAAVNISGSGKVNIFVEDYLDAKISGSGEITYGGQPKIDSKISGSGRLRRR